MNADTPPTPPEPLALLTHRALELLSRELGASETARFIGQFTNGFGDYTNERESLFSELTMDKVIDALKKQ